MKLYGPGASISRGRKEGSETQTTCMHSRKLSCRSRTNSPRSWSSVSLACRNAFWILITWVFNSIGRIRCSGWRYAGTVQSNAYGICPYDVYVIGTCGWEVGGSSGGKYLAAGDTDGQLTYFLHSGRLQPHRDLQFCGSRRQNSTRRISSGASAITG
jgi:hypothetical protein